VTVVDDVYELGGQSLVSWTGVPGLRRCRMRANVSGHIMDGRSSTPSFAHEMIPADPMYKAGALATPGLATISPSARKRLRASTIAPGA
jgi:hypothetical protein